MVAAAGVLLGLSILAAQLAERHTPAPVAAAPEYVA